MQEVDAADRFLDLQTFRHLARFDIPEPNCFVIGTTDQAFAFQEQRGAIICVTGQEPDVLREGILEIRLSMVQGTVE